MILPRNIEDKGEYDNRKNENVTKVPQVSES